MLSLFPVFTFFFLLSSYFSMEACAQSSYATCRYISSIM